MKKALLSLFAVIAFLPFAKGQNTGGTTFINTDTTVCNSFTWIDGQTYTSDTAINLWSAGHDTLNVLVLRVKHSIVDTAVVAEYTGVCSVMANGKEWKQAGTYLDSLTSVNGCDSIVKLNITLNGMAYDTIRETVCGSYLYGDSTYLETTTFEDSVLTGGCKRMLHVELTINPVYTAETEEVEGACSYTWHDSVITDTLVHTLTLQSVAGCDSVVSLRVTNYTHVSADTTTTKVMGCNSYKWTRNNQTYTTSGIYLLDTIGPRDSTCHLIYRLDLTIKETFDTTTTVTACNMYHWDVSDVYYYASKDTTVNVKYTNYTGSSTCDSISRKLKLTIKKNPVVTIEGRQDLTIGQSTMLHAICADSNNVTYKWYLNNSTTPEANTSSMLAVNNVNGNVDVHLETTGANSCVAHNWITVTANLGIDEVNAAGINLYPNPADRYLNIESREAIGNIAIFNAIGQLALVRNGNGNNMQLDLGSLANGQYTLVITTADGQRTSHKFIISK